MAENNTHDPIWSSVYRDVSVSIKYILHLVSFLFTWNSSSRRLFSISVQESQLAWSLSRGLKTSISFHYHSLVTPIVLLSQFLIHNPSPSYYTSVRLCARLCLRTYCLYSWIIVNHVLIAIAIAIILVIINNNNPVFKFSNWLYFNCFYGRTYLVLLFIVY